MKSESLPRKAFLLAAGLGTRLRPLTDSTPKCMLTIGGKPLLQHWLEAAEAAGVQEVLVNTHWLPDQVEVLIQAWPKAPMRVRSFYEPELLGSAGTLYANRAWAMSASEILILYADNLTDVDLSDVVSFHRSHSLPFSLGVFRSPVPSRCGIVSVDGNDIVTEFVEKPAVPASDLAAAGIYAASPEFFRDLSPPAPGQRPYDLGRDVLPRMAGRMKVFPIRGALIDIGTPESYHEAQRRFGQQKGVR